MDRVAISRRDFLGAAGSGLAIASMPRLALGRTGGDARFVLVILRGAMDGLALAPPYGDGGYRRVRGELALDAPGSDQGVLRLDGLFGLHPSLPGLHAACERREALIVHAVASPYRDRSHFDGQDLLESGSGPRGTLRDGWLNRAIAPLGGTLGEETAIALAQTTPYVLRGSRSVTTWAPSGLRDADEDTMARLEDLYADDPFFSVRLEQAQRSQSIASGMAAGSNRRRRGGGALAATMASAARFLSAPDGPRIAVVESGGWDTHANQGRSSGSLANNLAALDEGLLALERQLGTDWHSTVVAVVTEFGRTARVNGTRGTDHGTATAAILAGGAVDGGRVVSDWPGLRDRDLYEGRDLAPTTDLRGVFKAVLIDHLEIDAAYVNHSVFPDSDRVRPMDGLIRT